MTSVGKAWRKGNPCALLVYWSECKLVQLLQKTIWRRLKKLKLELPCNPAIPNLRGIYLKELKSEYWRDVCTLIFIVTFFKVSKMWKQPKRSFTDEWIIKMFHIYVVGYYSPQERRKSHSVWQCEWTLRALC